jgi:hypothetical protein
VALWRRGEPRAAERGLGDVLEYPGGAGDRAAAQGLGGAEPEFCGAHHPKSGHDGGDGVVVRGRGAGAAGTARFARRTAGAAIGPGGAVSRSVAEGAFSCETSRRWIRLSTKCCRFPHPANGSPAFNRFLLP